MREGGYDQETACRLRGVGPPSGRSAASLAWATRLAPIARRVIRLAAGFAIGVVAALLGVAGGGLLGLRPNGVLLPLLALLLVVSAVKVWRPVATVGRWRTRQPQKGPMPES